MIGEETVATEWLAPFFWGVLAAAWTSEAYIYLINYACEWEWLHKLRVNLYANIYHTTVTQTLCVVCWFISQASVILLSMFYCQWYFWLNEGRMRRPSFNHVTPAVIFRYVLTLNCNYINEESNGIVQVYMAIDSLKRNVRVLPNSPWINVPVLC